MLLLHVYVYDRGSHTVHSVNPFVVRSWTAWTNSYQSRLRVATKFWNLPRGSASCSYRLTLHPLPLSLHDSISLADSWEKRAAGKCDTDATNTTATSIKRTSVALSTQYKPLTLKPRFGIARFMLQLSYGMVSLWQLQTWLVWFVAHFQLVVFASNQ